MLTDLGFRLRAFWHSQGAAPRPGVREAELVDAEVRLGVALPHDVRSLYAIVNGTGEADGDDLFSVWPLSECRDLVAVAAEWSRGIPDHGKIAASPGAAEYVVFADCMISSEFLSVRVRPSGSLSDVMWSCGEHYAPVATSFEDFWERYLEDRDLILHPNDALIRKATG